MELAIWEKALDDAIRSAEMLVRKLKVLKNLPGAEEKLSGSVSAARLSEGVTLRMRSLPGHTGHPLAREHLRSAIREIHGAGVVLPAYAHAAATEGEVLPKLSPGVPLPCYGGIHG